MAVAVEELRVAASPGDTAALRALGERRFGAKDYGGALDAFGALVHALEQPAENASECAPRDVASALANRAACRLALADFDGASSDCNAGLARLTAVDDAREEATASRRFDAKVASVLANASSGEAALGAMLLTRKATALAHQRCRRAAAEVFMHAAGVRRTMGDEDAAADLEADAEALAQEADASGEVALADL